MMTWPTPWQWGNLLGAHLALNLGGWLGTAIIGTQHTFFPSLTRTRLRWRRLQLPTFVTWMLGIAALAAGEAFTLQPVVLLGWVLLTTANVLLGCNLAASWRTGSPPRSLPARLLASAHCLGLAGLLLGTVHAATSPAATSPVSAVVVLLLVGWIGLTVAGALMHLLAVVARIRGFATQLPQGLPIRDRALTLAATTAIIAWATGCEISVTRLASGRRDDECHHRDPARHDPCLTRRTRGRNRSLIDAPAPRSALVCRSWISVRIVHAVGVNDVTILQPTAMSKP